MFGKDADLMRVQQAEVPRLGYSDNYNLEKSLHTLRLKEKVTNNNIPAVLLSSKLLSDIRN